MTNKELFTYFSKGPGVASGIGDIHPDTLEDPETRELVVRAQDAIQALGMRLLEEEEKDEEGSSKSA